MNKSILFVLLFICVAEKTMSQVAQGPAFGSIPNGAIFSTDTFGATDAVTVIPGINNRSFNAKNQPKPTEAPSDVPLPLAVEGSNMIEDLNLSSNLLKQGGGESRPLLLATANGVAEGSWIPPDPHVAVGLNHVVFCDNGRVRITDKKGNTLRTININSWFSNVQPGVGAFDCKIIYDHFDNRWVMVWLDQDDAAQRGLFLLSVSDDDNPLGTWFNWALPSNRNGNTLNGGWGDYQGLGFDSQAIYLTANNFSFSGNYQYTTFRIIEKSQLYANTAGSVSYTDFWNLRDQGSDVFGIRPAIIWGNPGEYYLVSVPRFFTNNTYFTVFRLTNALTNPQLSTTRIPVTAWSAAPNANQLGGSTTLIEGGGSNVRNEPVFRNGFLYAVHAVASGTSNLYSSARYVKLKLSDNSVTEDVAFGAEGFWHIYPALIVDEDENVALTYSRSGTTQYVGAFYTWGLKGETLRPSETIQAGRGNYVKTFGSSRNRWGDYNGIALDPDGGGIWMFTEYAAATNTWGNWLHGVRLKPFSGSALYTFATGLDFRKVEVGKSDTLSFTIYSYGENPLTISGATTQNPSFQIVESTLPVSIDLYDSLFIKVVFQPLEHGTINDTLYIASNDAREPTYKVALTGKGVQIGRAQAGVLYAINSLASGSQLVKINSNDASVSIVGSMESGQVSGLTINQETSELIAFNRGSSSTTLLRASEAFGDLLPIMEFPLVNVRSLAFGDKDTLYVATSSGVGASLSGILYRVDIYSRDTIRIGQYPGLNVSDLAWNPDTKLIWVTVQSAANRDRISTINPHNGEISVLGETGLGNVIMNSLAIAPNGLVFGLNGTGTQTNNLYRLNSDNASPTLIASTNSTGLRSLTVRTDSLGLLSFERKPTTVVESYSLNQNYPNPFNPETTIEFAIPTAQLVSLKIYDVLGRELATLVNERRSAGAYRINFNATQLSSGTYFYQLKAGSFVETKKMILLK